MKPMWLLLFIESIISMNTNRYDAPIQEWLPNLRLILKHRLKLLVMALRVVKSFKLHTIRTFNGPRWTASNAFVIFGSAGLWVHSGYRSVKAEYFDETKKVTGSLDETVSEVLSQARQNTDSSSTFASLPKDGAKSFELMDEGKQRAVPLCDITYEPNVEESSVSPSNRVPVKFLVGASLGLIAGHTIRRVGRIVIGFILMHVCVTAAMVLTRWCSIHWQRIWNDLIRRKRTTGRTATIESVGLSVGLALGAYAGFRYTRPVW